MPYTTSSVNPSARLERLPPDQPFAWSLTFSQKKPTQFRSLIDDLKTVVVSWERRYIPETFTWQLADGYVDVLKTMMGRYGVELIVVDNAPNPSRQYALQELFLAPDAPPFVIEAVYRALAKQYHPDRGGDLAKMQRLNQLIEVVR